MVNSNIIEIFKDIPEIAILFNNDQELYQKYLDSIFPKSKIKDIFWHATNTKDLHFVKDNTEGYFAKEKKGTPNAIFFSKDKAPKESVFSRLYTLGVVLNIQNPYIRDDKGDRDSYPEGYKQTINNAEENGYDGVCILNTFDNFTTDVFIVFDSQQIHILGSKQDIQKAKDWLL